MNNYYNPRLLNDLSRLSVAFELWIGDETEFVIVKRLRLPPGFNRYEIDLLIELPPDYPVSPPGIGGYRLFIMPGLEFEGSALKDLHEQQQPDQIPPGTGPWAWLCYERIDWNPHQDNLIKFVEMVRADLSQPKVEKRSIFNIL